MNRELSLKIIMILSMLGIVTSLYLLQNHYSGVQKGSFCDFSETISCSIVNTSVYSELFNVPVALFGALWFFMLLVFSWRAKQKNRVNSKRNTQRNTMAGNALTTLLLEWNVLGFFFVLYMIYAEIALQAICPACTLAHLLIITTLCLSYLLYRREEKASEKASFSVVATAARPWIGLTAVLFLLPLLLFNLHFSSEKQQDTDALAQCLTEKGVKMYASFRCGVCAKTKEMFGSSFQYIQEIECHPQAPDTQWPLCQQKGITGTPTWIIEPQGIEQNRHTGFLSLDELRAFTGCEAS